MPLTRNQKKYKVKYREVANQRLLTETVQCRNFTTSDGMVKFCVLVPFGDGITEPTYIDTPVFAIPLASLVDIKLIETEELCNEKTG